MARILRVAFAVIVFVPAALALASGSDEPATHLEHRVDTAGLTGVSLLLAQMYNDHRLLYAVVTTASMAVLGVVIAFVVDAALAALGLRTTRMEHRE